MKKYSFLFVVIASALFAFVFAVSAQEYEKVPPINKTEAESILGTWYLQRSCTNGVCEDFYEPSYILTFNSDNTVQVEANGNTETNLWFMEYGDIYMYNTTDDVEVYITWFTLQGENLRYGLDNSNYMQFSRSLAPTPGSAALKEDSSIEDFIGNWLLIGMRDSTNIDYVSASLLNAYANLIVSNSTLTLNTNSSYENIPFEIQNAKIYAPVTQTLEDGTEDHFIMVLEKHEDQTILFYQLDENTEEPDVYWVFYPEELVTASQAEQDQISDSSYQEPEIQDSTSVIMSSND